MIITKNEETSDEVMRRFLRGNKQIPSENSNENWQCCIGNSLRQNIETVPSSVLPVLSRNLWIEL